MITHVSLFVCLLCVALVNAKLDRIVGGIPASPGQFKYQVSLQSGNKHLCGAAILNDQYILTAAHCVADPEGHFRPINYQVVAGSINLQSRDGVRIDVERINVPMQFLSGDITFDIAVLKLRWGLGLDSNPYLEKVGLPSSRDPSHTGETLVMAGQGIMYVELWTDPNTGVQKEINSRRDGRLKYAMVEVLSNSACVKLRGLGKIKSSQLCGQMVQREDEPEGICKGDSGGPLVDGNTVIGVASRGPPGCNEQSRPTVYTRVAPHLGFITKAMKDSKSSSIAVRDIYDCAGSSGYK